MIATIWGKEDLIRGGGGRVRFFEVSSILGIGLVSGSGLKVCQLSSSDKFMAQLYEYHLL